MLLALEEEPPAGIEESSLDEEILEITLLTTEEIALDEITLLVSDEAVLEEASTLDDAAEVDTEEREEAAIELLELAGSLDAAKLLLEELAP